MRGSCDPGPELSTMFHRCALTYTIYKRGRTCIPYTTCTYSPKSRLMYVPKVPVAKGGV